MIANIEIRAYITVRHEPYSVLVAEHLGNLDLESSAAEM